LDQCIWQPSPQQLLNRLVKSWRLENDGSRLGGFSSGYPAARLSTSCRWARSNLPWHLLCRCWNVSNCTWLYSPSYQAALQCCCGHMGFCKTVAQIFYSFQME
jgi:hypothetical protein